MNFVHIEKLYNVAKEKAPNETENIERKRNAYSSRKILLSKFRLHRVKTSKLLKDKEIQ